MAVTRSLSIIALTLLSFAFRMKNEAVWRTFSGAEQSGLPKANLAKISKRKGNAQSTNISYQRIQRNSYKKFFQMNAILADPLERYFSDERIPHIKEPQCSVMFRCDMAGQAIKADICTTPRMIQPICATKPKRSKTTGRWGDCPSDPGGKRQSLVAGFYMSVYDTEGSEISTR